MYFSATLTKSKKEETYHRGMIGFYPHLRKLNDKMVLETYTSTTTTEWGSFQAGVLNPSGGSK